MGILLCFPKDQTKRTFNRKRKEQITNGTEGTWFNLTDKDNKANHVTLLAIQRSRNLLQY